MKRLFYPLFIAIILISYSCSETPEEKLMRARIEINQKNFDNAVSMIKKILIDNPKMAEAYYYKGLAELESNKSDSALASFSKTIEINKNYVAAYIDKAKIENSQRKFNEAIIDYTYAISLFPKEIEWIFQRGVVYYNSGQKNEACFDFRTASEMGHIEAGRFHQKFCNEKSDSLSN
jgi:tetratricopeptide (TPR) repeat protein